MCSLCKATFICYVLLSFRNNSRLKSLFVEGRKIISLQEDSFWKVLFQVILHFIYLSPLKFSFFCWNSSTDGMGGLSRSLCCLPAQSLGNPLADSWFFGSLLDSQIISRVLLLIPSFYRPVFIMSLCLQGFLFNLQMDNSIQFISFPKQRVILKAALSYPILGLF